MYQTKLNALTQVKMQNTKAGQVILGYQAENSSICVLGNLRAAQKKEKYPIATCLKYFVSSQMFSLKDQINFDKFMEKKVVQIVFA